MHTSLRFRNLRHQSRHLPGMEDGKRAAGPCVTHPTIHRARLEGRANRRKSPADNVETVGHRARARHLSDLATNFTADGRAEDAAGAFEIVGAIPHLSRGITACRAAQSLLLPETRAALEEQARGG